MCRLCFLPIGTNRLDPQAESEMKAMQTVMDLGRSAREKRGISLKTPVKGITVVCKDEAILKALEKLQSYVKGELNAWEVGDKRFILRGRGLIERVPVSLMGGLVETMIMFIQHR